MPPARGRALTQAAANLESAFGGSGAAAGHSTQTLSPFVARHIGPSEAELQTMLADLGVPPAHIAYDEF